MPSLRPGASLRFALPCLTLLAACAGPGGESPPPLGGASGPGGRGGMPARDASPIGGGGGSNGPGAVGVDARSGMEDGLSRSPDSDPAPDATADRGQTPPDLAAEVASDSGSAPDLPVVPGYNPVLPRAGPAWRFRSAIR